MAKLEKDTFCSYCGTRYAELVWPRKCQACARMTWRNPTPVAVAIQPVGKGVLVIRRGIEPQKGQLALPGGYVDIETWPEAVAREMREETQVISMLAGDQPFLVRSSSHRLSLLLFGVMEPIEREADLPPFAANEEVNERLVVYEPVELCFSSHTEALRLYFGKKLIENRP